MFRSNCFHSQTCLDNTNRFPASNCKQPTHKWWDLNILHFVAAVATKVSVLTAHNVLPGEGEPKKLSTFSMLSVGWIFTSCCSVACTALKIAYPSISKIEVSKKMYFIFNSLMLMIIISPKHCQIRCELIFFACLMHTILSSNYIINTGDRVVVT